MRCLKRQEGASIYSFCPNVFFLFRAGIYYAEIIWSWNERLDRRCHKLARPTIERLSIGGELPINTSGGLLGEAYIHGMNGITEVVRQIRGTSCNQVARVEHALVTAGTGVPTSGLILSKP